MMYISPKLFIGIFIICPLFMVSYVKADCICVASGDPHITMCDGRARYDWQGLGLFQLFQTNDVEVQCSNIPYLFTPATIIDYCRIKITSENCDLVIQTPDSKSSTAIINGKNVTDVSKVPIDPELKTILSLGRDKVMTIDITRQNSTMKIKAGPGTFSIAASKVDRCTGMCGTCSGHEVVPKDLKSFGEQFAKVPPISGGNMCVARTPIPTSTTPSPSTATPAPTTFALNTSSPTSSPTPTPTGPPTTMPMQSLPPSPQYVAPNDTAIPDHPVFENETVMKTVVKQCLCGQDESRMKNDPVFGGFVENCIYDKSLGPGTEKAAETNMIAYTIASDMLKEVPVSNVTDSWTQTNYTTPIVTEQILTRTVNKRPEDIPVDQGVTYELKYTKSANTGVKATYLQPRRKRWSVVETAETVNQQPQSQQSQSISSSNMSNMAVKMAQKLKLHFDIEAPVIVLSPAMQQVATPPPPPPATNSPEVIEYQPRRKRSIPISESDGEDKTPSRQPTSPPAPSPPSTTTSPTPSPTTISTPAPTPGKPAVRQFQIATVVRSRDVPSSEIKLATPAPELPLSFIQQIQPNSPPVQIIPMAPVPATPIASAPVAATPIASTPVAATPIAPAPVAATPIAPAPVAATPIAPAPVAATPIAPAPVAAMTIASAPVAATPMGAMPVAQAPVPGIQIAPIAASPMAAIPIAAAPAAAIQFGSIPMQGHFGIPQAMIGGGGFERSVDSDGGSPLIMEARLSPQQLQAKSQDQAQQRRALENQQQQQRQALLKRQKAQMDEASRPRQVMVPSRSNPSLSGTLGGGHLAIPFEGHAGLNWIGGGNGLAGQLGVQGGAGGAQPQAMLLGLSASNGQQGQSLSVPSQNQMVTGGRFLGGSLGSLSGDQQLMGQGNAQVGSQGGKTGQFMGGSQAGAQFNNQLGSQDSSSGMAQNAQGSSNGAFGDSGVSNNITAPNDLMNSNTSNSPQFVN